MQIPSYLANYAEDYFMPVTEHILLNKRFENVNETAKKIMIISGFSGSGKDTLIEKILEKSNLFGKVKTVTTRKRRVEESEIDDPYIRLDQSAMRDLINSDEAIESVMYAGEYYCTTRSEIERVVSKGKIPILRIDPKGTSYYVNESSNHSYLNQFRFAPFFVVTESTEELRQRLIARGSDEGLIQKRMNQLQLDLGYVALCQYLVLNSSGQSSIVAAEMVELVGMG